MSNLEAAPEEILCAEGASTDEVEFLVPREVPLGGPRAMPVRRTLPQKQRSLIGAWCFLAIVRPGEVNLMIAGRGISHQEFSTPDTGILHGAQLWYALPDATRNIPPTFEHYAPKPVSGDGTELRVFIGSLAGSSSSGATQTPPPAGCRGRTQGQCTP
jgi:redox-sensitive bicupin YhaK (pirin superfamily)